MTYMRYRNLAQNLQLHVGHTVSLWRSCRAIKLSALISCSVLYIWLNLEGIWQVARP